MPGRKSTKNTTEATPAPAPVVETPAPAVTETKAKRTVSEESKAKRAATLAKKEAARVAINPKIAELNTKVQTAQAAFDKAASALKTLKATLKAEIKIADDAIKAAAKAESEHEDTPAPAEKVDEPTETPKKQRGPRKTPGAPTKAAKETPLPKSDEE